MKHLEKVREVLKELNRLEREYVDGVLLTVVAETALQAHEEEVRELVEALSDCVEALTFLEERTATRTNPPTLERARAALRPFGDEK